MAALNADERGVVIACPKCAQKNRIAYERLAEPVKCGQCKHELTAPAAPIEVASSVDFDEMIAKSSLPVVVDYWAPWCGPCRMVAPEFDKVAAHLAGRVLVAKVNTDVVSDLRLRFNIRSIPTMAVFGSGRELARTTGARPANEIEAFIEQATLTIQR